ncbi:MAG TPA: MarR family transcriptional regulator [Steroidobacteraceae bacterium]|nr:MarR family transcriptional regulator [Steroidobacteraceae bacterium]
MPASQLPHVAANLRGIARRVPQLPLTELMICRVALILGRDLNSCLDRVLRPEGLAEPEYRVLAALYAQGGSACPRDLCAALAQSPANLTRIGDTLVRRGFVSRSLDAKDRRRMQLKLRPSGQRLLDKLIPAMSARVQDAFEGMSATEKKRLLASLTRLLQGIDTLCTEAGRNARVA